MSPREYLERQAPTAKQTRQIGEACAVTHLRDVGILYSACATFGCLSGLDNNILVQIGLIDLIGLAAKNAILIVEFARQAQDDGATAVEAAINRCRLRLRSILTTAFAFILGVVLLMIAEGPGAELRQSFGTAVFSGMLSVTSWGCSSHQSSLCSCGRGTSRVCMPNTT